MSHQSDWKPGHVTEDYRNNYDSIFKKEEEKDNVFRDYTCSRQGISQEAKED